MSGIQSSVGLVTGLPIQETVEKLLAISARPKDSLVARTNKLQSQQVAITELTALVIGVQLSTDQLGKTDLFTQTGAASSQADALAVRKTGNAKTGIYQFVPIRQSSQQQATSSYAASVDEKVGAGQLVIHAGGFLDSSLELDLANGGRGISRGYISITDRAGNQQNIDLRFAKTASDVVTAINSATEIRVSAKIDGDRFVLTDLTGSTASNLKVADIGTSTTASDLGLGSINTNSNTANGADIVSLSNGTALRSLLDGRGISFAETGASLRFSLRDGSSVDYVSSLDADKASLGQLIEALNTAGAGKFEVSIGPTGDALRVVDLTSGTATFAVSSPTGSLAKQLGFDNAASGATITGDRLRTGLSGALLSSLNGGDGLGTLGSVRFTDRSGANATVNFASAQTLSDVVSAINGAGIGVAAQLNETRTGITIVDTTGSTSGNLIVATTDTTQTAEKLKINGSVATNKISGGSLNLQWVNSSTRLADYNFGQGISSGSFSITDSTGRKSTLNFSPVVSKTIGDVIDSINALSVNVEARVNETGDGLLLVDRAGGTGPLIVEELSGGQTAKQLGILGTSSVLTVDGSPAKGIDGSTKRTITTTSSTTVDDLVESLNDAQGGVRANIINLGSSGVRVALNSVSNGLRGRFAVDSSALNLGFTETSAAQDALLSLGGNANGGGVLLSSNNDKFADVIEGLELTVNKTTSSVVTVTVSKNTSEIAKKVRAVVDQYNKVRDKLTALTAFDEKKKTGGLLFGSTEALRVDFSFSRLFTTRITGAGSVRSTAELGINYRENGRLEFDESKLNEALERDPAAVQRFFTDTTNGFSKKAKDLIDTLTAVGKGMLISKSNSLQTQIEQNSSRIVAFDLRLSKERNRLLLQFYNMEKTISKMKDSQSALNQIQNLASLT